MARAVVGHVPKTRASDPGGRLIPFTVEHFTRYSSLLVFDDGESREPEPWQLEVVTDVFAGFPEVWMIVPEGNGKSTLLAELALYGADYSKSPWIPVGASSARQARIIYDQAAGFVERTPGMGERFRCFGGYKLIRSVRNGGIGIEVFAAEVKTGDGVIPYPYALLDELHRQEDMRLYGLWKGKLRKRGAQILTISTAGEPETPFENTRDEVRRRATKRKQSGSHLRAEGPGIAFHEWMVPSDEACADMDAVKAANPLSSITVGTLSEDFASPTMDLLDWKRLKCNRPTRSIRVAITDGEWDKAQRDDEIPAEAEIDLGLDVAFKWDTTAAVPLYCSEDWDPGVKGDPESGAKARPPRGWRLLGKTEIIVPPRDGTSLHPDVIKNTLMEMTYGFQLRSVVMDMSKAEDIAAWIEDELGVTVIDHPNGNQQHVADYNAIMEGLRNKTLFHTGDVGLRSHVLNAIARRLPGGDHRFDRPTPSRNKPGAQDRRVIDALTAAAMVTEFSLREMVSTVSVYEDRYGQEG